VSFQLPTSPPFLPQKRKAQVLKPEPFLVKNITSSRLTDPDGQAGDSMIPS